MPEPRTDTAQQAGSQTLARGLDALMILAAAPAAMTIAELSQELGVHRSNAYRILRTLEDYRFVIRDDSGSIRLGPRLLTLARGVTPELHTASLPELSRLAHEVGMTSFVSVLDAGEVITVATVEPTNVAATVARNPGVRHPVDRGAPGRALESSLTADEREVLLGSQVFSDAALEAKRTGFAVSRSEVIPGVSALAVPLRIHGEAPATLAVVHFQVPDDTAPIVERMRQAAARVAANYR